MLVLIAVVLALIPAIAILYPFLRSDRGFIPEDEGSDLVRRWELAVAGLKNTELDHSVGNLTDQDYLWLRRKYMADATSVMADSDIQEQQKKKILADLDSEVSKAREIVNGKSSQNVSAEADCE